MARRVHILPYILILIVMFVAFGVFGAVELTGEVLRNSILFIVFAVAVICIAAYVENRKVKQLEFKKQKPVDYLKVVSDAISKDWNYSFQDAYAEPDTLQSHVKILELSNLNAAAELQRRCELYQDAVNADITCREYSDYADEAEKLQARIDIYEKAMWREHSRRSKHSSHNSTAEMLNDIYYMKSM